VLAGGSAMTQPSAHMSTRGRRPGMSPMPVSSSAMTQPSAHVSTRGRRRSGTPPEPVVESSSASNSHCLVAVVRYGKSYKNEKNKLSGRDKVKVPCRALRGVIFFATAPVLRDSIFSAAAPALHDSISVFCWWC
jgi:hypothetical protein